MKPPAQPPQRVPVLTEVVVLPKTAPAAVVDDEYPPIPPDPAYAEMRRSLRRAYAATSGVAAATMSSTGASSGGSRNTFESQPISLTVNPGASRSGHERSRALP